MFCQLSACRGQVPGGVDWAAVVKNSMDRYSVEIAGGLGPTAGKVWRVGVMVRAQLQIGLRLVSVSKCQHGLTLLTHPIWAGVQRHAGKCGAGDCGIQG